MNEWACQREINCDRLFAVDYSQTKRDCAVKKIIKSFTWDEIALCYFKISNANKTIKKNRERK